MLGGSQAASYSESADRDSAEGPDRGSDGIEAVVAELSRPRAAGALLGRLMGMGRVGEVVARVMRSPLKFRWQATRFTRFHARVLRLSRGRLRRSWLFAAGQPVIALTTIGRRSGLEQTTTVTIFFHDGKVAIAGVNLGMPRDPGWAYNLNAKPEAKVAISGRTIAVLARQATGGEREALWQRWIELQPAASAFAGLAQREIPIFVLEAP